MTSHNEPQNNKPRVGIFVDVQNIYYTCRESYRKNFDYNAFWAQMKQQYTIDCEYLAYLSFITKS